MTYFKAQLQTYDAFPLTLTRRNHKSWVSLYCIFSYISYHRIGWHYMFTNNYWKNSIRSWIECLENPIVKFTIETVSLSIKCSKIYFEATLSIICLSLFGAWTTISTWTSIASSRHITALTMIFWVSVFLTTFTYAIITCTAIVTWNTIPAR